MEVWEKGSKRASSWVQSTLTFNPRDQHPKNTPSWCGDWDFEETGVRSADDIDPDDIKSIFNVYALGDLGVHQHTEYLTQLERMVFQECWPGVKVSRHEIKTQETQPSVYDHAKLSKWLKVGSATAINLIETFKGLEMPWRDAVKIIRNGINGWKMPQDLNQIMMYLHDLDMELPELPENGRIMKRIMIRVGRQLGNPGQLAIWKTILSNESQSNWLDLTLQQMSLYLKQS